ncbi:MAG: anaerobic ribonucleoside triphosphate reductase [Eubacterium sp.]
MIESIIKRNGDLVPFDDRKIHNAIYKANLSVPREPMSEKHIQFLTSVVMTNMSTSAKPTVEEIQDIVEETLIGADYPKTAKAYILYRAEHAKTRAAEGDLMEIYKDLTFRYAEDADLKRENANIDSDTAMGTMLKYGSEGAKYFVDHYILPKNIAAAHISGDIHIHDKDFYMLTETCCQIDLLKLFKDGFSTGHGFLREPNDIRSYSALACIAIQANQNEMHGGQSVPNFDYSMAPGVAKTFEKLYYKALFNCLKIRHTLSDSTLSSLLSSVKSEAPQSISMKNDPVFSNHLIAVLKTLSLSEDALKKCHSLAFEMALNDTDKATYQAMEAFIHNLNTMNSRAGAQVPFSSINYGTDTSAEARLVIKNLLRATEDGLGNGETPIFPVQIFKVKEGVNYNKTDPNYDLFQLAIRVSAKRLFPNFSFLDAPFNAAYYKEGNYDTEVAYMGCRTRVMGNSYDPTREITSGRGNLSFTSVNLPRIALESEKDRDRFYAILDTRIALVAEQLLHRFKIQCHKLGRNYPFLMGQGVWIDSENLEREDRIEEVLKHGTLSLGFIGLAETLKYLTGFHHGECTKSQSLGLEIISHMRHLMDALSEKHHLNFTLLATPAEGLSGRFIAIDKEKFGIIPGVTDREFYTNSFHVPVYYPIQAFRKIQIEAPYHALTNAGHISYVELDGDASANPEAFEAIIRFMKESGIGYGSINHPVDRDPVCGYNGIIGTECPACHRTEGDGAPNFERIRRITGYLVGTTDRWNNAKRAEEKARIKHGLTKN